MHPILVYKQYYGSFLPVTTDTEVRKYSENWSITQNSSRVHKKPWQLGYFCSLQHFCSSAFFLVISVAKRMKLEQSNCHWLKLRISEISERILSIKFPVKILENQNYTVFYYCCRIKNHSGYFSSELKIWFLPKGYSLI